MTAPLVLDVSAITTRLDALEAIVATAAEQITALSAKVDDIAADFSALVAALNAERENLTEAGQAALDAADPADADADPAAEIADPAAASPAAERVPSTPWGMPRLSTCDGARPVIVAVAADPAGRVDTVPTVSELARE